MMDGPDLVRLPRKPAFAAEAGCWWHEVATLSSTRLQRTETYSGVGYWRHGLASADQERYQEAFIDFRDWTGSKG